MIVEYACASNDNHLRLSLDDESCIDEVLVTSTLKDGWLVVGIEDLRAACAEAGWMLDLRRKDA